MMKKTPKPMAHKENLDIPIEDNQPQGQFTYVKKELRFPTSSTGDVETPKNAKQIEPELERVEHDADPKTAGRIES
jgi:hypothetical protein